MRDMRTLSVDEVSSIHDTLVQDFAESEDPISPAGVRSDALLESAVGRQYVGIGSTLKYPTAIENAATLLYGLCNDHPFYNGNKRTALVATLVHLDKNKLTIYGVSQGDLYQLMLSVASHTIVPQPARRKRRSRRVGTDDEVAAIARWLKEHAAAVRRGDRTINSRELRRILESFGYRLENPSDNMIEVVVYTDVPGGFLRPARTERRRIGNIGWTGDNRTLAVREIKRVRQLCRLREEDGVDSDAFYREFDVVDSFVNRYRTLLRRLART
jgi:death-on-curing protein